jgi:hypothetical protein
MTYFVKFVPYNANTLSSLINKTIKFSTVYEFNDANELNYIASPQVEAKDFRIHADLKTMLDDLRTRWSLFENALKSGRHDRKYMSKFKEKLNKYSDNLEIFDDNEMRVLIENLVFSSVGIFCTSRIDVFCDDSAQLMFAHYADNLKGLALIYENSATSTIGNVDYIGFQSSAGLADRASKWLTGDFTDISDFKSKSRKWEYEQESRIFNKPSIASAKDSGVELKAILYTSRFNLDNIKTLETINNKIYDSNLKIKEIYNSYGNYEFRMAKEKERSIKWLESLK